jgi:hypothetical protein
MLMLMPTSDDWWLMIDWLTDGWMETWILSICQSISISIYPYLSIYLYIIPIFVQWCTYVVLCADIVRCLCGRQRWCNIWHGLSEWWMPEKRVSLDWLMWGEALREIQMVIYRVGSADLWWLSWYKLELGRWWVGSTVGGERWKEKGERQKGLG